MRQRRRNKKERGKEKRALKCENASMSIDVKCQGLICLGILVFFFFFFFNILTGNSRSALERRMDNLMTTSRSRKLCRSHSSAVAAIASPSSSGSLEISFVLF